MNINNYIEKNDVIIEDNNGFLKITLKVAPIAIVEYAWQENEDTKHYKVRTTHMVEYLSTKGYNDISVVQHGGTDNKHPKGLTSTWVFKLPIKKTTKRTKRKSSEKREK
jgi:hypothetical protein